MQAVIDLLRDAIIDFSTKTYQTAFERASLVLERTKKEHQGDLTLLVFPLAKKVGQNPEALCQEIGNFLLEKNLISEFNVIKGFLNLSLSSATWSLLAHHIIETPKTLNPEKIVLEYCGPNTNKPLHIGHIRNLFLGFSTARILSIYGHDVHKVNIYNDRGIAICKSMMGYQLFGNGTTPESTGIKPDHFVGNFYVKYAQALKTETEALIEKGMSPKEAEKKAPSAIANEEMLRKWEAGDEETVSLWNQMNDWVYEGLKKTYEVLQVDFEKEYYESTEYLKGKEIVSEGLAKGVFKTDESGAAYIDLTEKGLDKKIVQRGDGTSIYITQDLALIRERYRDYKMDRMIYVVADEQNYHFKVLNEICQALQMDFSKSIYHLSYGMVTSKDGSKFKSREGTAADADDIIADIIEEAKNQTLETGKANHFSAAYLEDLSRIIGLGALRFSMLKVNPKKNIPFDAKENVDLNGDTAPFIQYSYVRTKALLNKANFEVPKTIALTKNIEETEKELLLQLAFFGKAIEQAALNYDPSEIAQYAIGLAKAFNRFYHHCGILNIEDEALRNQRLTFTWFTNYILEKSLWLLGIEAPEKM
jgi:arginyl-tRNA synthetase